MTKKAGTTAETTKETGRTPSMFASLLVLGVMVGLILLSVIFFGSEVAEGPLQVSMTLSTLFALSVALYYGFRGSVISEAVSSSVNGTMARNAGTGIWWTSVWASRVASPQASRHCSFLLPPQPHSCS